MDIKVTVIAEIVSAKKETTIVMRVVGRDTQGMTAAAQVVLVRAAMAVTLEIKIAAAAIKEAAKWRKQKMRKPVRMAQV